MLKLIYIFWLKTCLHIIIQFYILKQTLCRMCLKQTVTSGSSDSRSSWITWITLVNSIRIVSESFSPVLWTDSADSSKRFERFGHKSGIANYNKPHAYLRLWRGQYVFVCQQKNGFTMNLWRPKRLNFRFNVMPQFYIFTIFILG